jgi:hypothetical protein
MFFVCSRTQCTCPNVGISRSFVYRYTRVALSIYPVLQCASSIVYQWRQSIGSNSCHRQIDTFSEPTLDSHLHVYDNVNTALRASDVLQILWTNVGKSSANGNQSPVVLASVPRGVGVTDWAHGFECFGPRLP